MVLYNLEPLLLNLLFIIIPLFLFQIFWMDKGYLYQKSTFLSRAILILCASLSIVLCMSFPVEFSQGFIFDLSQVPFILGALYGGYRMAIPLFSAILIYRFFIGGDGVYVNFIVISLILIFVPLLKSSYHRLSFRVKAMLTTTTSVVTALLVVSLAKIMAHLPFFKLDLTSFYFVLIQGLSMWFITYLVETIIHNFNLKEKVLYAEKLNVISQLAASVTHEVRNPLTVSKGFLQLLRKSDLSTEQRNTYLDLSLAEINRAEGLINDFLAMAKSSDKQVVLSNLKEDIRYVTNVIKPYAVMHNVEVKTTFDNVLEIKYDRNQLKQCLINLTKNSVEAMDSGGTLTIDVNSQSNNVLIFINDTGIGMTKEQLSQLGSPYFTTKSEGTGLGMMMVFNTIKALNGEIKVISEKGKGTLFSIKIPAYSEEKNQRKRLSG